MFVFLYGILFQKSDVCQNTLIFSRSWHSVECCLHFCSPVLCLCMCSDFCKSWYISFFKVPMQAKEPETPKAETAKKLDIKPSAQKEAIPQKGTD